MEYIQRSMESVFRQLCTEYSAILVTGPRQVGKTTMLQRLSEEEGANRRYVTLDDLNDRALAISDPAMFFQLHPPPIFIDEVQYAPELFPYIKIMVDRDQRPGDFWLTGSQLFKLMDGVQESLAGRVALLHLSPLSQHEIFSGGEPAAPFVMELDALAKRSKQAVPATTPEMFKRIFCGGMPGLISGRFSDRSRFYSNYLSTYMERDVKDMSGAIDSLKFLNFVTACAARASQLVNYKGIADDSDIDQKTAKSWLRILEALGIVYFLHPYSNNVLKRTVKTPKMYFYDTGLICYLTKWTSAETAEAGAMNGALLENYAVTEVLKSYQNSGADPFLYYYRDKDGNEIDLLMERDGMLFPIEIKKTAKPDVRLTKIFSLLDKGGLKRGTGAVLCMVDKLGAFDSENLMVPIYSI